MSDVFSDHLHRLGLDILNSPLLDRAWYRSTYPDLNYHLDVAQHFLTIGLAEGFRPNEFMDPAWYYDTYPDVLAAGVSAFLHYLEHGWREMRDPGPGFSTSAYLAANRDVDAAGVNPLLHYLEYGRGEGRIPMAHASSDAELPTLLTWEQVRDSTLIRLDMNLLTSPLFDRAWYQATYPDLNSQIDMAQHFLDIGMEEGRCPNAYMDPVWYYENYPSVRVAGMSAFLHYLEYGWRERRDPGPWFSTSAYLDLNQDVLASGMNPLLHYLEFGRREGRSPMNASSPEAKPITLLIPEEDRACILVRGWIDALSLHGFAIDPRIVRGNSLPDKAKLAVEQFLLPQRSANDRSLTVSFNGAGLTTRLARKSGTALIVVFDDVRAARSLRTSVRKALAKASGVTSSPTIADILRDVTYGAGTCLYPEPMSRILLQPANGVRTFQLIRWCSPPRGSAHEVEKELRRRRNIIERLSDHGLRLFGDEGSPVHGINFTNALETQQGRSERACYGESKLVLVSPPIERAAEVTPDMMAALASGALPIAPYEMGPAVFALFGDDCPVPLYKDDDELLDIVRHFLSEEEERNLLTTKCRRLLPGLATYSTRIGEMIRKIR